MAVSRLSLNPIEALCKVKIPNSVEVSRCIDHEETMSFREIQTETKEMIRLQWCDFKLFCRGVYKLVKVNCEDHRENTNLGPFKLYILPTIRKPANFKTCKISEQMTKKVCSGLSLADWKRRSKTNEWRTISHQPLREEFREISSLETTATVCQVPLEEDDDLVWACIGEILFSTQSLF